MVAQEKDKFDKYVIDEIAKKDNKTVLRLPPYHSELNPIEIVWLMVKEYIKNNSNTCKDVKQLLEQGIDCVKAEHWSYFIKHIRENEEKKMWKIDDIADKMIDGMSTLVVDATSEIDSETSDNDY